MKRSDDIRRLLREADPAEGQEMAAVERARMRAVITSAARGASRHRSYLSLLAVGAALAAVAVAFVAMLPRGDHRSAENTTPPTSEAPEVPALPAPAVASTTAPVLATLPGRSKPAHERPRLARLPDAGRITRIVFTGPEGTKILWFVGTPDAKELGS